MAQASGTTKEKEIVLITGCSDGGIGSAMALEFAKAGYSVVATARSVDRMKELSSNENIHLREMDVLDFDGAVAGVHKIIEEYGHIDILVNNAGVLCVAPVAELSTSLLVSTMRTNVVAPVLLINTVAPHMVERRKGTIVNVGSIATFCPAPLAGAYVASKAAIAALTDALRLEMRPFGIKVMLLIPGAVASNIGATSIELTKTQVVENLKIFKPFEEQMVTRPTALQNSRSTPTAVFAKKAVAQVLAKNPPAHYTYGHLSTLFSTLYFTPTWFRDFFWAKVYKLNVKVPTSTNKKTD